MNISYLVHVLTESHFGILITFILLTYGRLPCDCPERVLALKDDSINSVLNDELSWAGTSRLCLLYSTGVNL